MIGNLGKSWKFDFGLSKPGRVWIYPENNVKMLQNDRLDHCLNMPGTWCCELLWTHLPEITKLGE